MNIHTAHALLERWAQRRTKSWNMHQGYQLIAQDQTNARFHKRVMDLAPRERPDQVVASVDICSIEEAKRLIHEALVTVGVKRREDRDWVLPAWKWLREHELGQQV